MMKSLSKRLLLMSAVASLVFIYSCGDDEEPTPNAPELSVSASVGSTGAAFTSGGSLAATDSIIFSGISVTAPGGFNVFRSIAGISPAVSIDRNDLGLEAGATSSGDIPDLKVVFPATAAGSMATITFVGVDDINQADTVSFDINITDAPSPDAKVLTAVILAAPTGDNTSNTFYSIRLGELYSQADILGTSDPVSENVDIAYYYGNTDEATLVSPDEYPTNIVDLSAWGTRNTTNLELTTLSNEDYTALSSVDDVNSAVDGITFDSDNTVTNLSVGDILAFQMTDASEIAGFIKVNAINGTFNAGDGIEIEIITNQEAQ